MRGDGCKLTGKKLPPLLHVRLWLHLHSALTNKATTLWWCSTVLMRVDMYCAIYCIMHLPAAKGSPELSVACSLASQSPPGRAERRRCGDGGGDDEE